MHAYLCVYVVERGYIHEMTGKVYKMSHKLIAFLSVTDAQCILGGEQGN